MNWNFIKVISKPNFVDLHVLRENWYEAYMSAFGYIFRDAALHGVLELVGVRCYIFSRESINSVWLDCDGISWWLVSTVSGEIVNLCRVFLVTSLHTESYTRTVIGDCERHRFYFILVLLLCCFWFYYFFTI